MICLLLLVLRPEGRVRITSSSLLLFVAFCLLPQP